jgi:hypothetical protein
MTLLQTAGVVSGLLVLATVVEALTEYLARPIVKAIYAYFGEVPETMAALRYVGAVVGVALCLAYGVDLLALTGLTAQVPFVGPVVTGLLIGRGANFVNDFLGKYAIREK